MENRLLLIGWIITHRSTLEETGIKIHHPLPLVRLLVKARYAA